MKYIFRGIAAVLISLGISACIEYEIGGKDIVVGEANPAPIPNLTRLDRVMQVAKPKTDILWIIDNSCSMTEEQTALTNNFDSFINYFIDSGLDWHVGVISTDMLFPDHQGRLRSALGFNFIDEDTPQPTFIFRQMAAMGVTGSGTEKGLDTSYNAIEVHGDDANKDFYREDGLLSIIVISDEPDFSTEISAAEYISWLLNLKIDSNDVTFSSIVCLQEGNLNGVYCSSPPAWSAPQVGKQYIEVTNAVGGVLWDIREADWSIVLEELGFLASGLRREFFLSDIPAPETIEVWVDIIDEEGSKTTYTFEQGMDYTYSKTRNSITFITYVPPQHATINIEYDLLMSYTETEPEDTEK
jgi:hypothetical protein